MPRADSSLPPAWTAMVRIAVVVGLTMAGLLFLVAVAGQGDPTDTATLVTRIVGGALLSAVVVAVIVGLLQWVGGGRLADIGLGAPVVAGRAFIVGALAWLLPAGLAFGALAVLGAELSVSAPAGRLWVLVLLLLAVLLSEAIPEEVVFRGYVTAVLAERLSAWWVIVVQTVLFTLTAVALRGGAPLLDISLFVAMGLVLGYLRMVTGSVWTTIGFHTAFQTGSQLLLTHDVVEFAGSTTVAMLALGAIPFTAASIMIPLLAARSESTDSPRPG